MPVTLKFQSSGTVPGNGRPVSMQGGSLTVGRGPANDLVLPDPDRLLSKNHFVIEDHNGNVVIVDLSTNGTFLNYSKIPLGKTPTPLNNGDVLALGSYELVVEISNTVPDMDDLLAPAPMGSASHGDASRAPDPLALLDDAGPEGDFLDNLLGPEKPVGPSQFKASDPIDDLLPPLGEDEDPFFQKPSDGREGEGASLPSHNPSAHDAFRPQSSGGGQNLIPDDWDDLLDGIWAGVSGEPELRALEVPDLTLQVPDRDVHLRIFRGELEDVLANLLRNAAKASATHGCERLALRVDLEEDFVTGLERVAFRVCDDAPRTVTTAMIRSRYIERGLGLTVDLISRNGGSIHVEDEPGWSKAVVVRFPAAELPPEED